MDYSRLYNFFLESYAKLPYRAGGGHAFRPITLFVEVTYRCNFRCSMCQFYDLLDDPRLKEKKDEELTTAEIKNAVDQVLPLGLICFTGGEPLLRGDIMELVRHSCRRHKVYLVTNGILLSDEISRELVELGCHGIFGRGTVALGVSVEGMGKTHDETVKVPGSFEKIIQNVRLLVEAKKRAEKRYPLLALKCVMTKENTGELDELYRLAQELELDIFNPITLYNMTSADRFVMAADLRTDSVQPMNGFDSGLLKEQLKKITDMSKSSAVQLRLTPPGISMDDVTAIYENRLDYSNKVCYAPWSMAALSAYGDVFPCSNYSVGNIRNEPLLKLWNGELMAKFRKELKEKRIFKSCGGCCEMVAKGKPSSYPPLST
jgi:radical SAM protein with 4Fe4S-binding SPASM domain